MAKNKRRPPRAYRRIWEGLAEAAANGGVQFPLKLWWGKTADYCELVSVEDGRPQVRLSRSLQKRFFNVDWKGVLARATEGYSGRLRSARDKIREAPDGTFSPNTLATGAIGPILYPERSAHAYNMGVEFTLEGRVLQGAFPVLEGSLNGTLVDPNDRYELSAIVSSLESLDSGGVSPAIDDDQDSGEEEGEEPDDHEEESGSPTSVLDDALEGLFLERAEFEAAILTWRRRKNLILQGPPGVGKSHIARRLAYALMAAKEPTRVRGVQFHQAYSYEDFVQGWRPAADGGFERRDGVFLRFCEQANTAPSLPHVLVIDEINRGNLSKIFGELMVLIEADKRSAAHAMPLTYFREGESDFFVPSNVYVLGLMNTADRSLALVDYALRRRFAFLSLVPQFASPRFRAHMETRGVPRELIGSIVSRLSVLNERIANDTNNLGPGFCIGHSYFCPGDGVRADHAWYEEVIRTEIAPLIQEYWFDDPEKAAAEIQDLLS